MADTIRKLTHTAAEVDDNIDEVVAARGTFDSLDERLDATEVPEVGVNDDGKILKASYTGGVGTYSWQTGGGGGGGTSDYSDLDNKPQINSITLSGNKTSSDLGLQSEIDSSHKLSADLIDDTNATNKFVTASDKNTWNGKQDALTFDDAPTSGSSNPVKSGGIYTALSGKEDTIADLSDIRTGAGKGATAIQSVKVNNTALTPDANKAVDITAVTGVKGSSESSYRTGQVSISKTNIGLSNLDNYKQVRALSDTPTSGDIVTWGANGYAVADSGKSVETSLTTNSDAKVPTSKAVSTYVTGLASSASPTMDGTAAAGTSTDYARADHVHPTDTSRASATAEAEDRAALVELVDGGAKSLLPNNAVSQTLNSVVFVVNADGSVKAVSGTASMAVYLVMYRPNLKKGKYVISGSDGEIGVGIGTDLTSTSIIALSRNGNPVEFELTNDANNLYYFVRMSTGVTANNSTVYPMLCTKAAWDISHAYQPYRPSYQELYERVVALEQGQ